MASTACSLQVAKVGQLEAGNGNNNNDDNNNGGAINLTPIGFLLPAQQILAK